MTPPLGDLISDALNLLTDENIQSNSNTYTLYDSVKSTIDEILLTHIDKHFPDVKDIFVRTSQTLHRCGHIFRNGDLIYHCRYKNNLHF